MRLIIVSNRLPFSTTEEQGDIVLHPSPGGVATGLDAYTQAVKREHPETAYMWIGWPGSVIEKELQKKLRKKAEKEYHALPVFLSEEEEKKFYYGFPNKTIWPLFHNFASYCIYREEYWAFYKRINRLFSNEIVSVYTPGDVIVIHDYHLMLVPSFVREVLPNATIGFFLHIPFPTYEIFNLLPKNWKKEIIEGILGANLVGFHTYDYVQYFLQCARRLLGYEHRLGHIVQKQHMTKVTALPLGIDMAKFAHAVASDSVSQERQETKKLLHDHKVILSVDRLDYTKGIANRLYAYELFLQRNPEWHNKVVLALVAAPSRTEIFDYQLMKQEVDELIGGINGKYGSIAWTPIVYQYRSVSFKEIVALYGASDVILVTPIQDGMNLVAKEYIASRTDKTGVLILSETAGAAKELTEVLLVNPNSREEMATAMKTALEMPVSEQKTRNSAMLQRLWKYDINKWTHDFHAELSQVVQKQKQHTIVLTAGRIRQLLHTYQRTKQRLLIVDYDGTLIPFVKKPLMAKPTKDIISVLSSLAADTHNEIVLVSGRDKQTITTWFGSLRIALSAEHGAWIKEKNKKWRTLRIFSTEWKDAIGPILYAYTDRLPGAMIEEKDFSLAWHYRNTNPEISSRLAKELLDDLIYFTANTEVHILQGNKVIEVKNSGITKADAVLHWLERTQYDFILAVGDDTTDEDMFAVLPDTAYTIKVGQLPSRARFSLNSPKDVLQLLQSFY